MRWEPGCPIASPACFVLQYYGAFTPRPSGSRLTCTLRPPKLILSVKAFELGSDKDSHTFAQTAQRSPWCQTVSLGEGDVEAEEVVQWNVKVRCLTSRLRPSRDKTSTTANGVFQVEENCGSAPGAAAAAAATSVRARQRARVCVHVQARPSRPSRQEKTSVRVTDRFIWVS